MTEGNDRDSLKNIIDILSDYRDMLTGTYTDVLPRLFELQDLIFSNPEAISLYMKNERDEKTLRSLQTYVDQQSDEIAALSEQNSALLDEIAGILREQRD